MISTNPSWPDWTLVFLIILYIIYSAATDHRTRKQMIAGALTRGRFYFRIILTQWFGVLILFGIWRLAARPISELGMAADFSGSGSSFWSPITWAIGPLYSAYLLFQIRAVGRSFAARQTIRAHVSELDYMMPQTLGQLWGFTALGLTAAICEEILFRGFLLWWCQSALGVDLITAAAISTLIFGFGHAYQGWQGVLRTTLVGALLMAIRLAAGSIWPAILLHAVGDILGGWLVYRVRPMVDDSESTLSSGSSPTHGGSSEGLA